MALFYMLVRRNATQRYVFSLYSCLHLPTLRILTHISALAKLVYCTRMAIVTTRSRLALRKKEPSSSRFEKRAQSSTFFSRSSHFRQCFCLTDYPC